MLKQVVANIRTQKDLARFAPALLGSLQEAALMTDCKAKITYLNPAAEKLIGWSMKEARGLPAASVVQLLDENSRDAIADPVELAMSQCRTVTLRNEAVLLRRSREEVAVEGEIAPMLNDEGNVVGAIIMLRDVSRARKAQLRLAHAAHFDPLTGLVNRREFELRAERALASARSQRLEHALCFIDLDQFKIVNDTCGHAAGDELLRNLAQALRARIGRRAADTLARLGGDEFGLLLLSCPLREAQHIAAEVLKAISQFRFEWHGRTFAVGASIGLTAITSVCRDLAGVFSAADAACYAAKEKGRNRIQVYTNDDVELAAKRGEMTWVNEIRNALDSNRFALLFQPIPSLQGPAHRHIEIFTRMLGSANQLIQPSKFIPAAERYHLMPLLDRWVIETAFSAYRKARTQAVWSLNISTSTLACDGIFDFVRERSRRYKVPPQSICFEIKESAAHSSTKEVLNFIWALKMDGYRFALDDFGAGMSSFSYLKTLPLDYLKIDGELIKDILNDKVSLSMVEAICRVAQGMELKTIAERVESRATVKKLKELGVNYAQGYLGGRPAPLSTWIAENAPLLEEEKPPLIGPLSMPN